MIVVLFRPAIADVFRNLIVLFHPAVAGLLRISVVVVRQAVSGVGLFVSPLRVVEFSGMLRVPLNSSLVLSSPPL